MDQSETSPLSDMKPLNAATDTARVYNEPSFSRNSGSNDGEDVTSRLSPKNSIPLTANENSRQASRHEDPSWYYDMSGDKFLIIFNHYQYEKWQQKNFQRPEIRKGTYKDVESLEKTFRSLGFEVFFHDDCTHKEIKKHMSDLCKMNHKNTSCVAVAVMTHGIGTYLCAADTLCPVTDITEPLCNVPTLAKKPKLFFIQACREKHIQPRPGHDEVDVPVGEDCLLLYSAYEDYVSYREEMKGSWMMRALCEAIDTHHGSKHLVQMIKYVNKMVARKVAGWDKPEKQMTVTEFNLMKFVKF